MVTTVKHTESTAARAETHAAILNHAHRSPLWTASAEAHATAAHDALLAARGAKKAHPAQRAPAAPTDTIPALHAGGALYEPSQTAPRHNGILCGVIMVLALLVGLVGLVRRLREPWALAAFALIIAAAAAVATWGG
jgi:hypothetical protein